MLGVAVGYAQDTPKIPPRYAQNMPIYPKDMTKICPKYAHISTRYAQDMVKTFDWRVLLT